VHVDAPADVLGGSLGGGVAPGSFLGGFSFRAALWRLAEAPARRFFPSVFFRFFEKTWLYF